MKPQVLLSIFAASISVAIAQVSTPKYSNEFLSLGVGARSMAMSKTQVAICDDITSGYWNPAGLTKIDERFEGGLMHAGYFAGMANYDYFGFSLATDSLGRIGISVVRFAVDDIPDTRYLYDANGVLHYDNIQFFSAADYALLISYARKIPRFKNLRLGGNVKIIHRKAGEFAQAWGFGLDAGLQWEPVDGLSLGLMLKDFTGTFNAWTHNPIMLKEIYSQTGNQIPENTIELTLPKSILGIGYKFRFSKIGILTALDLDLTFDGKRNTLFKSNLVSAEPKAGLELDYDKMVFLRLGAGNAQQVKDFDGELTMDFQPDFGVGFKIKNFKVDYALTDLGNQSEVLYSHIFSLIYGFSKI